MNKETFLLVEGDNFFNRNHEHFNIVNDVIIKNLKINENSNILEIGCSNGWRLSYLKKQNTTCNFYGIDPSKKAINSNVDNEINLSVGTCDDLQFEDEYFDVILIPFVFMYIDRKLLLKSIGEIDRVLKNGGKLMITDFYPNKPRKNSYKHIDGMYIYKQKYFDIFISTQNYF